MFLRIARAQGAKQSGIRGGKRPFDTNILVFDNDKLIIIDFGFYGKKNYARHDFSFLTTIFSIFYGINKIS